MATVRLNHQYERALQVWRQQYNPLRSLNMGRVVLMMESAEAGMHSDLQWTYRFIEKRDAVLRAVKRRRQAAICRLPWKVKVREEYAEDKAAAAQQEYLTSLYNSIDNMFAAIKHLASAEFRGFAHLEKWRNSDGEPMHLEPVPQWHWAQKWPSRDWLFNERAEQTSSGVAIDLANFVIREVDDPIDEVAIIAFMRKNLSQKDWDGFVETYGIPPLFLEMPEGTKPDGAAAFQTVVEQVVSDGRGALPPGSKIQPIEVGTKSTPPFSPHLAYQDQNIVLAGTSGKLTVLNDPTGLGSGQSEVHADTFSELAQAEAKEISEVLQRQVDAEALQEKFPGQPPMVYFDIAAEDVEDVDRLVEQVARLDQAGIEMDVEDLADRTGYQLRRRAAPSPIPYTRLGPNQGGASSGAGAATEEDDDEGSGRGPKAVGPETDEEREELAENRDVAARTYAAVVESLRQDVSEVSSRLQAILAISDKTIRNRKLSRFRHELPRLIQSLTADGASQAALQNGMAEAVVRGMQKQLAKA